jgi:hypothetical protein
MRFAAMSIELMEAEPAEPLAVQKGLGGVVNNSPEN